MNIHLIALLVAFWGIAYTVFNYVKVKSLDEGTAQMVEIAGAIRSGANTFLICEYKVLAIVVVVMTGIFGYCISTSSAISFCIGVLMSGAVGYIGMKMATYANVRVTNISWLDKIISKSLRLALRGGAGMGIPVAAFVIIALEIVRWLFGGQLTELSVVTNNIGIEFVPYSMTLSNLSLGCSVIAMFNRIGGGIFTKAADMGADLVGKAELGIPEDDPRNPAVIADCVGDNVGDVAGLGSDLMESYMGAMVSAMVLVIHLYISLQAKGLVFSRELFDKLLNYPIVFASIGLFSSIIALICVIERKDKEKDKEKANAHFNPHKELNKTTWIAAVLTAVFNILFAIYWFKGEDFGDLPFKFGEMSLCLAAGIGIVTGIVIGKISEIYTSEAYKPTQEIASASKEGSALTVVKGLAVGMKSPLPEVLTLGIALILSANVAGDLGVAMAAVGMLSFVSVTVSVDAYGPISDNAGGIAEMCGMSEDVRTITDTLDSAGNTTAAIGKGFAIGSAAFATMSMLVSYMYTYTPMHEDISLNLIKTSNLAGLLIGGAVIYFFSGLLTDAACSGAQKMVDEVRRQFEDIPGLMEGTAKPDSNKCIEISTKSSLLKMVVPSLLSIVVPVVCGFLMGTEFVASVLIGCIASAIMLAIFFGNSGGAWDNAKKYIEALGLKGTLQHIAAVVGDTIGDPLKDTVCPALDICIKIMVTVSIIGAPFFEKYHLF